MGRVVGLLRPRRWGVVRVPTLTLSPNPPNPLRLTSPLRLFFILNLLSVSYGGRLSTLPTRRREVHLYVSPGPSKETKVGLYIEKCEGLGSVG